MGKAELRTQPGPTGTYTNSLTQESLPPGLGDVVISGCVGLIVGLCVMC